MSERVVHRDETAEWVFGPHEASELHIRQEAGSSVRLFLIAEGEVHEKVNWLIEQAGEQCRCEIYALARLHGEADWTLSIRILHQADHGQSLQVVKSVLSDRAHFAFAGSVSIEKGVKEIEAQQTNRNLLLSDDASVRTQPQLIIHADDVKASHGATTGQLDEQALFYMQQRGLSRETAKQMLVEAFCDEILSLLPEQ